MESATHHSGSVDEGERGVLSFQRHPEQRLDRAGRAFAHSDLPDAPLLAPATSLAVVDDCVSSLSLRV